MQEYPSNVSATGLESAVVLLSGGLDSAVTLAIARAEGQVCHALSFDYGQRHRVELLAAARIARALGAQSHRVVRIDLRAIGGSALTAEIQPPRDRDEAAMAAEIPVTYVPARNMTFISIAAGLAEVVGAGRIYLGINAVDYSGYPDCRAGFVAAFQRCIEEGTKAGVEGRAPTLHAPLVQMTKADIIREGARLGVDLGATTSCYDPLTMPANAADVEWLACGRCDACHLRKRGFLEAGVADSARYAQ